ncbi:MAG: bifunctional (p)ppGpp synthetase/guanosine-3',5'-bis(diphosphate) 3'-pyrophosphohydrolase [Acidobacteriota bacterium]|jgi:GTP pyrophosphokinase|nr:bifunctional (p)ppGpp synthetase/guanosine-3',5'-bis(diphosphate) 3'-pyrophosphohydrolase [Acidobacteriota bacterium]
MIRYQDLAEQVTRYHPGASVEVIQRGYVVSAKYHKGQVRQSGEPYLTHPLEVANILAGLKLDAETVTAGLLHDVLEDTLIGADELRRQFGEDIFQLVDGVTKIAQMRLGATRQAKQAETFRKMLLAMVHDIRVLFVKLADRLHNMRTLQHLPPEKRERIALETLNIYAPLAHRLGMSKIRGELEDLSFSFLDPAAYQHTVAQIEARRAVSKDFIDEAEGTIRRALDEHGIPARLESRIKRIYGVYNKMKRQKITIDEVFDFIAIRVITDTVEHCYSILGLLHNLWKPVPGRIRDYIAIPRMNLYQSLHTSVIGRSGQPFEIQIRTEEMHFVAEEGLAAHWKYKEGKQGVVEGEEQFRWLRQLIESQQEVSDPREFLNNLKIDLYQDEVYCFTPKGEVITLPRDATPVDFAYAIHSEIGNKCVAAKVNGRIVPLRYKIKHGEIVEVLTDEDASPRREWLSFVKTSRTRNKIRRFINQKEREAAAEVGRALLEKESQRFGVAWKKVLQMPELFQVMGRCGLRKVDEIYPAVGYGMLTPRQILGPLFPDRAPSAEASVEHASAGAVPAAPAHSTSKLAMISNVVRGVFGKGKGQSAVTVKGSDDMVIYRAKCCNPILGDDILGYITRGKGIFVHMADCPSLKNLLGTDRIIDVEWVAGDGHETFEVHLNIVSEDKQQVLAEIITAVSKQKVNIRESRSRSLPDAGRRIIDIMLDVSDVKQLQKIVQGIKSIEGIEDVERERQLS